MPSSADPRRHRDGWPALGALGLVSLAIQLPFLRRGLSIHDEGSILAIAEALSRGEVLYRDRLTTIAPLTYELLGALFDVFGPSFLLARILMMGIFSACVVLGYSVLRRVASRRAALTGALALLALKPIAFHVGTMLNYSQVAVALALVAVLLGVRFFERRRLGVLFAAGVFAGATLLSKLNFGGALGLALGIAVGADWLREPARRSGALVRRGCTLGAGALAPVALAVGFYATHGAAGAFLDQSIVRVVIQRASYWTPLPSLAPWAFPSGPGMNAYLYFPAPIFSLGWHGTLDFTSIPLVFAIEILVKAAYYVPVLLMGLGVAQAIATRTVNRSDWSARVLLVALAAG
ncbi:MAG: glycosyltransferase family 39 protein, partial [Myxococcota bacterium]